jgi:Fic family protein
LVDLLLDAVCGDGHAAPGPCLGARACGVDLIHPFREGNGRLARLLNTVMAFQAGFPALDYGAIRGRKKREYIAAIHAAMDRNYAPMEAVFAAVLKRSERGITSKARISAS